MSIKSLRYFGIIFTLSTYAAVPKITSVLPTSLSCGIDDCLNKTITITGTGFNNDAKVPALDGLADCTSPSVVSGSTKKIVCTLSAQQTAASFRLKVKNDAEGTESVVTKSNFSLSFAAPKVSYITPKILSCGVNNCEDQEIKITGTGFRSDAKVPALDGLARCEQPNPEGTEIVCKLNEQTMNRSLKVAVRNDLKNQTAAVSSTNFTLSITPLTIRYISPSSITCGLDDCVGQEIKIVGQSFKSDASVPALAGIADCDSPVQGGASFTNEAKITCRLRAQSKDGAYKVAVTSNNKSSTSLSLSIKTATLSVTSVTPSAITCGNNDCESQQIVIRGTGFKNDAAIPALEGLAQCDPPTDNGTKITCSLSPQSTAKTHTLFVRNGEKNVTSLSSAKLAISFALPKITSISPSSITCGNNDCLDQQVTINGSGFRSDATVPAFTGFADCDPPNTAGTQIVCYLREQAASRSFKLAVTNSTKNQTTVIGSDNFSVKTVPFAFSKVSPSSLSCDWDQCENQQIKITGTGFRTGTTVPALENVATCEEPNAQGTEITCTFKKQVSSAAYKINVRNIAKNLSSNNLTSNFQINLKPLPSITSFDFNSRPNCEGYKVTINGTNFGPNPQLVNFPGYCEAPTNNGTRMSCFTVKQTNSNQSYDVRVYNPNLADNTKKFESPSSVRFNLSSSNSCPSLSYTTASASYFANEQITTNTPIISGFTPSSYSIHPALPEGLSLNPTTGVISGTPSSGSAPSSFNITASDSSVSLQTSISLGVVIRKSISYKNQSFVFVTNKVINDSYPIIAGFTPTSFTITPELPTGLNFDTTTGAITGTPTTDFQPTNFVVTATDSSESVNTTINIKVVTVIVKNIYSNYHAFAALKNDNSVFTWGYKKYGGDSSSVENELKEVKSIFSNPHAFAALKENGTVVTWGEKNYGGDSSGVKDQLTGVKSIFSTSYAFAALKENGTVVTWGNTDWGADSSAVQDQLTDVKTIFSTHGAFAALKENGSVVTWGNIDWGADSSRVQDQLTDVITIFSNGNPSHGAAFAALKENGTVVTWGHWAFGGDGNAFKWFWEGTGWNRFDGQIILDQLTDVKTIFNTTEAFAALKEDGTVVTWGSGYNADTGSDSSKVTDNLVDIKNIFSNPYAFAALTEEGSVVTWGGYDSSAVQDQLTGVKSIFSTHHAFAALKENGTVVTWGHHWGLWGSDSSGVQDQLTGVKTIFSTVGAFAALKENGSVVTWGKDTWMGIFGGNSSAVQDQLIGVKTIFNTAHAFAALKEDGTVVTWGDPRLGGDFPNIYAE